MKTLIESLLDNDDELFDKTGDIVLIENFLKENFTVINRLWQAIENPFEIRKEHNKFVVYVINGFKVLTMGSIESLTNGLFEWGKSPEIGFDFSKTDIKSLEGAPEECARFDCSDCKKLTSLANAPKICKNFNCSGCSKLTSLKGVPSNISIFACKSCKKLTTLEGGPIECEEFTCKSCSGLTSLKGMPQKGLKVFNCDFCVKLKDFKYFPQINTLVDIDCKSCSGLTSLKNLPNCAEFNCSKCTNLTSLKGGPSSVWKYTCDKCDNLTSLEGAPESCSVFNCRYCNKLPKNKIENLKTKYRKINY